MNILHQLDRDEVAAAGKKAAWLPTFSFSLSTLQSLLSGRRSGMMTYQTTCLGLCKCMSQLKYFKLFTNISIISVFTCILGQISTICLPSHNNNNNNFIDFIFDMKISVPNNQYNNKGNNVK